VALSNWDTLAFNTDGKPAGGSLELPSGAVAEIYKNWLYIHHPKMQTESSGFASNCIAQIQHGEVQLAGFDIIAARHDLQNSVFVFVQHHEYEPRKEYYMAGIGCYGFKDNLDWLKENRPEIYKRIPEKYLDEEKYWHSSCSSYPSGEWGAHFFPEADDNYDPDDNYQLVIKSTECPRPELSDLWIGVNQETFKAFQEWLETVAPKEYLAKIDLNKALRFNQGDAFFAANLGGETPATEVGQQQPTIFSEIIKDWKKEE